MSTPRKQSKQGSTECSNQHQGWQSTQRAPCKKTFYLYFSFSAFPFFWDLVHSFVVVYLAITPIVKYVTSNKKLLIVWWCHEWCVRNEIRFLVTLVMSEDMSMKSISVMTYKMVQYHIVLSTNALMTLGTMTLGTVVPVSTSGHRPRAQSIQSLWCPYIRRLAREEHERPTWMDPHLDHLSVLRFISFIITHCQDLSTGSLVKKLAVFLVFCWKIRWKKI